MPLVTGGRYGLSSKELTPGMVAGVFAELARERPRRRFFFGEGFVDDPLRGRVHTRIGDRVEPVTELGIEVVEIAE